MRPCSASSAPFSAAAAAVAGGVRGHTYNSCAPPAPRFTDVSLALSFRGVLTLNRMRVRAYLVVALPGVRVQQQHRRLHAAAVF